MNTILLSYLILSYPLMALLVWWTVVTMKKESYQSFIHAKVVWKVYVLSPLKKYPIVLGLCILGILVMIPIIMPFLLCWKIKKLFKRKKKTVELTPAPHEQATGGFPDRDDIDFDEPVIDEPQNPDLP